MSKIKNKIDRQDDRQMSLFDMIIRAQQDENRHNPGSLAIDIEFRELVTAELKSSPHSRYHVASRMSELTGTDITKTMLDSWTAESKEFHRFPAIFLPAFCVAVGSSGILDFLGRKSGVFVLPGEEALRSEIQKLKEERDKLGKRIKKRKALLEAM